MSIGVLLRGFIGDMMDFGDVILYTLFPSFMTIQACTYERFFHRQSAHLGVAEFVGVLLRGVWRALWQH